MTGPPAVGPPAVGPPAVGPPAARPVDVDTGFWLWLAALPLMTTGYVVNLLADPAAHGTAALYPIVGLTAAVLCVVVVTFLVLMRSGYRWARTVLTGGGVAAVVYSINAALQADARPVIAVTSAVTGIVGSVLIAGGTLLLHRTDAQGYFTR